MAGNVLSNLLRAVHRFDLHLALKTPGLPRPDAGALAQEPAVYDGGPLHDPEQMQADA